MRPVLECVERVGAKEYVAIFGYSSSRDLDRESRPHAGTDRGSRQDGAAVELPVGRANRFVPGSADRNQPRRFEAGRFRDTVRVPFDGSRLTWVLAGHRATAHAGSRRCPDEPRLIGVVPDVGSAGQAVAVTISARDTSFSSRSELTFGEGISVGGAPEGNFGPVTIVSPTELRAYLEIGDLAAAGSRTVRVRTGSRAVSLEDGFAVIASNQPPSARFVGPDGGAVGETLQFDGAASTDPDGDDLTFRWSFGDGSVAEGEQATHAYDSIGAFDVTLTVDDGKGGLDSATGQVVISEEPTEVSLPPDPRAVAPPLSATTVTSLLDATAFLYSGDNPIQTGVAPGTIELARAAVLRGRVLDRAGEPISGVALAVLEHPELGQTLTRADGSFDLAVNGGGVLTLHYERSELLGVQRQVTVPWNDYTSVPDVVMIPFDPEVSEIALGSTTLQVARGSETVDEDGARRATLFVPAGTNAEMTLPDGSVQMLAAMHVRATEYTIGSSGPLAMPAPLPPSSGYTYALELSADEAIDAGASRVAFSQALPLYVENFMGFPVGTAVPAGYYDRERGAWVASRNGRIVELLDIVDGDARLDVDGDGVSDAGDALTALGITSEELGNLARLFSPGQTLWRVPITHFTPWDCNWPFGPPPDFRAPRTQPEDDPPIDRQNEQCGSIIGCEEQSLGQVLPIAGTPWTLHYQSRRTPGQRAAAAIDIPVTGDAVPASVRSIRVDVDIAGQSHHQTFTPGPGLRHRIVWDGKDGYGRALRGRQYATVRVTFDYAPQYFEVTSSLESSFARAEAMGLAISVDRAASRFSISRAWSKPLEAGAAMDARLFGLGGWSLEAHHAYDASSRMLLRGDGREQRGEVQKSGGIITTVAGDGSLGFDENFADRIGDGEPALNVGLRAARAVATGPDGSVYIATGQANNADRVRRVSPVGIITTVAGGGCCGLAGTGEPALGASLGVVTDVAIGPDEALFIASGNGGRVWRVSAEGILEVVAGGGPFSQTIDEGRRATDVFLGPLKIAVGPERSLYIVDAGLQNERHAVRRVGSDGIITTVAGGLQRGFDGDGGPASRAHLDSPHGLAVGPDGSLYIADAGNRRIRRVSPNGIIATVAGSDLNGGDGEPATSARLSIPVSVAVAPDFTLFIKDTGAGRVRRVSPGGIISAVAGDGLSRFAGDLGPAAAASLAATPNLIDLTGIALAPDGSLYIADTRNLRIRHVRPAYPTQSLGDTLFPDVDGDDVFVFDGGRHMRTLVGLTGAVKHQFTHDGEGFLTRVTDSFGNETSILREGATPTAIIAPGGQRTTLHVNAQGWLERLENPQGESHTMTYDADGLLQTFTDPVGNVHRFTYDDAGRLIRDDDPAGGSTTLTRTLQANGYTVTTVSALGRTHAYQVESLPAGGVRRTLTDTSGGRTITLVDILGGEETTSPDGTFTRVVLGPDPRWGMLAPIPASVVVRTPAGLTRTLTSRRSVALAEPVNPFSLTNLTDIIGDNGAEVTTVYDGATRTWTVTTDEGRISTSTRDEFDRTTHEEMSGVVPFVYDYEGHGLLASVSRTGVGVRRTSNLRYDSALDTVEIRDPLGGSIMTSYDAVGRPTTQRLPDGQLLQLTYDPSGNVASITPPGRTAHEFLHTVLDQTAFYGPPSIGVSDASTTFAYDLDRALRQTRLPGGRNIDIARDTAGRIAAIGFERGAIVYGYDPISSRRISAAAPGGGLVRYGYDGGLLTSVTWTGAVSGSATYRYDGRFRVTSEAIDGQSGVTFTYDTDGLLLAAGSLTIARDPGNGLLAGTALGNLVTNNVNDALGDLVAHDAAFGASSLFSCTYERDALGRIVGKTENIAGVVNNYEYAYDAAGNLSRVVRNGTETASYEFDGNGNRTAAFHGSDAQRASHDDQDRLLDDGVARYVYRDSGELLTKTVDGAVTSYDYDSLGQLRAVTLPGGTAIDYVIDAENRRIGKRIDGVLVQSFLYQGQLRPIAELDGAGRLVSRFVYATQVNVPDYMIRAGVTYRIITDHLGSPRLVVDTATGAIAQRIDYDEFGRVLSDTNPRFQPFGFAGGLADIDTGLVRFGARDYDPAIGRWTAKDPLGFGGGDTNFYNYAHGDPINLIDPTGTILPAVVGMVLARGIAGAFFGAIGGAIGNGLGAMAMGCPFASGLNNGAIGGAIGGFIGGASGNFFLGAGIGSSITAALNQGSIFGRDTPRTNKELFSIAAAFFVGGYFGNLAGLVCGPAQAVGDAAAQAVGTTAPVLLIEVPMAMGAFKEGTYGTNCLK